jgi:hypothetical protein
MQSRQAPPPPLADALVLVAGFVGTFEGDGAGDYPTIEPFRYRERVVFGHAGKPFLSYRQRTWDPRTQAPMHAETGYLRLVPSGDETTRVEFVVAQPTGIVELHTGSLAAGVVALTSTLVGATESAKPVHAVRRRFHLDGDRLTIDLWMAYAHVPDTHHLHAELRRVD